MTSGKTDYESVQNNNQYNGGLVLYGQNITGTTVSSDLSVSANALTTGTGMYLTSSSITTGKLANITTGSANTWTGNGTTNGLVDLSSSSTAGGINASSILL